MGMFGEAHASHEAERLLKVLEKAKECGSPAVLTFARRVIWPLYLDAKGEAFEKVPDAVTRFWSSTKER